MDGWWLVTWTTYGSWLPGDPRGFRTWRAKERISPPRRFAAHADDVYDPAKYANRYSLAIEQCGTGVRLDSNHRQVAMHAIIGDLTALTLPGAVIAIADSHVHLVAQFGGLPIRPTVGRLKSVATRAMKDADSNFDPKRSWTKGCHMESLNDEASLDAACRYVAGHVSQGAVVYTWPGYEFALPSDGEAVGLGG
jgi:hypothetical protein